MAVIACKSQDFPIQVSGWRKSLNLLVVGESASRRVILPSPTKLWGLHPYTTTEQRCEPNNSSDLAPFNFWNDNCRDPEYWPLEGVRFATKEAYWLTNRQLVDVEAKALQEAYRAAREEPFRKETR